MSKKVIFLLPLVIFTLAFSACSSQEVNLQTREYTDDTVNFRRPDFGQPEREANLRGVVTALVGNEVTILELGIGRGQAVANTEEGNKSEEDRVSFALSGAAPTPAGGPGLGMGAGRGLDAETDRAAMIENLKAMTTGETKIIIPVGIRMLKFNTDNQGAREPVEASLTDIKTDSTLTLWLDQSVTDRQVAEFVLIN